MLRRLYGAHPAHLAVVAATLVLGAVALRGLLEARPVEVAVWLIGAAVLHDLLLLPAYVAADAALVAAWRRWPGRVAWLNFVRVPVALSALLLLVYSPTILRLADAYGSRTAGRDTEPYLGNWLVVTAVLAGISVIWYLARLATVSASRSRSGRLAGGGR